MAVSVRYGVVVANWSVGADVEQLVELGVAAEHAGWDGVFLADHLIFPPPGAIGEPATSPIVMDMPDPWITLAAIASRTSRITLATWITPIPRRQPWQFARDVATLDRLSGGRVLVGAGLGRRPDHELFGSPWDFPTLGRKCDEALELIDRFWTGEKVFFDGEHYTVSGAAVRPTPAQRPRVPIVIGGIWPKQVFLRRGARWDGIVPHFPGDGIHPQAGVPEREVAALLDVYHALTDDPGEILLPLAPPGASGDYTDLCVGMGATWLYDTRGATLLDAAEMRAIIESGPPSPRPHRDPDAGARATVMGEVGVSDAVRGDSGAGS